MRDCWNCRTSQPEGHRFCQRCGQPLAPGPDDRRRLAAALDYLLREAARWDWADAARREALQKDYADRRERLLHTGLPPSRVAAPPAEAAAPPPRPERLLPPAPGPIAAPTPAPAAASVPPAPGAPAAGPSAAPGPKVLPEAGPFPGGGFTGLLEERNIRWVLLLGGLLLASAGFGLLRNEWSAHGRPLVSLALLLAPVLCFTTAWRLRADLPVSSRILAVVGGLLLPTGLVATRLFGLWGSAAVPWNQWNLGAFTLTALVLLALASGLGEVACLYLGTLSLAVAAAYLGQTALWPPMFGLACLAVAFVYLGLGWRGLPSRPEFRGHLFGLSQALAMVGLSSTLPSFGAVAEGSAVAPLGLLLLGALFFVGSGYLMGHPLALAGSAPVALAFIVLFVLAYDQPLVTCGLGVLALGTGYLAAGRGLRTGVEDDSTTQTMAALSDALGTGLTGLALLVLFGLQMAQGLPDNFASMPPADLGLGAVTALLATLLYGVTAGLHRSPRLVYAATACLAYAWFLGAVLLQRPAMASYPAAMAGLSLALVLVAWPLRNLVPAPYLAPLVEAALALGILPGPVSLAMRAMGVDQAGPLTPWTLLLSGLAYLAAVPWLRSGWPLYFGLGWGAAAYATWLPLVVPGGPLNLGLAFLPLLAGLGFAALRVEKRWGRDYALPVARIALVLAAGLAAAQLVPDPESPTLQPALALAGYSLGFAALGWLYRDWPFLDLSARDLLYHLAALVAPAALWVGLEPVTAEAETAVLALSAVAAAAGAWRRVGETLRPALARAAMLWSSVVLLTGPASGAGLEGRTLFAYGPAAVWLLPALLGAEAPWTLAIAALVLGLAPALLLGQGHPVLGAPAVSGLLLALVAGAWAAPPTRGRYRPCLLLAWAAAGGAWAAMLEAAALSGDARVFAWWPFCAALAALVSLSSRQRPDFVPWLEACTVTSTLMLACLALVAPTASTFQATNLALAAAYLLLGWRRPSPGYFLVGWALLALAPLHLEAVVYETDHPGRAALALALMVALAVGLERGAGERMRLPLVLAAHATAGLATLVAWASLPQGDAAMNWGLASLALVAAALGARGALEGQRWDYHLGMAAAYPGYLALLDRAGVTPAEIWLAPPALWLLGWSEVYRREDRRGLSDLLAALGLTLLLAPALLSSTGPEGLGHAAFLVGTALVFLVTGLGRRHRAHAGVASVMILLEIGLQAVRLAILIPWWYVALAAGLLLVGLGILFERRRMDILQAGRRLLGDVSGW